jgi:hypothetical protein
MLWVPLRRKKAAINGAGIGPNRRIRAERRLLREAQVQLPADVR